ncbi:hypothetical protein CEXT_598131 [Caerostris extrusa]|uniref:Uncharacterized protein n=1 Tax=Caerostris extrusa TaxID=172846 RepID=A0AAV4T8J9_CAEEX|nr:hypothetical protein CEXT_598131 [Caerostris extrusa]
MHEKQSECDHVIGPTENSPKPHSYFYHVQKKRKILTPVEAVQLQQYCAAGTPDGLAAVISQTAQPTCGVQYFLTNQ